MRGIEDHLGEAGYTLLIVNTEQRSRARAHPHGALRARQVDGFIAATARLDAEPLARAATDGIPVVLVNRSLEDGSLPAVTVDDRKGITLAVEHVVGLGHTQVGHVAGPQNVSTGHQRRLGFVAAMKRAKLGAPAQRISVSQAFTEPEGARTCEELLAHEPQLTAIVAANDRLAIGCYDTLEAHGLSCPDDVSIVGFNDMPFVDRLRPPLTTVRVPQREIGTVAADLLLEMLADGTTTAREILLEPALIVRGSTAPGARQALRVAVAIDAHAHVIVPELLRDRAHDEPWRPAVEGDLIRFSGRRVRSIVHPCIELDQILAALERHGTQGVLLSLVGAAAVLRRRCRGRGCTAAGCRTMASRACAGGRRGVSACSVRCCSRILGSRLRSFIG